jgi:WD40 repeat protein
MLRPRLFLAALGITVLAICAADAAAPDSSPDLNKLTGVQHLVYAPDGKSLLIEYHIPPNANGVSKVGVWDVETGKLRVEMEKPPSPCENIALSADGRKAAAISAGQKQLKVWDAGTGKLLEKFQLPEWKNFIPYAPFLAFSADGDILTSVLGQKILRAKQGGTAQMLPDELARWSPELITFAPAADLLVFASNPPLGKKTGSKLHVYDLSKPGEPQTVPLGGWIRSIAFTADGKTLAVSREGGPSGAGKVELWDASAWKVQGALPLDKRPNFWSYRRLFFSPDGKVLAGAPTFGDKNLTAVELLDLEGKIIRQINAAELLNDVAFSPDGKTVAISLGAMPVQFLDPATGKDKEP